MRGKRHGHLVDVLVHLDYLEHCDYISHVVADDSVMYWKIVECLASGEPSEIFMLEVNQICVNPEASILASSQSKPRHFKVGMYDWCHAIAKRKRRRLIADRA